MRDERFARVEPLPRRWLGGDPVASAWFTALSASFPRGEALFIESVRQFRDGVPSALDAEIRAFIRQEVNHSREHLAFNRAVDQGGYDLTAIDARVAELVERARSRPPIVQLGVTIALEHFTAMFAHQFLTHPEQFAGEDADPEQAAMWLWHAVEEIEHKGVAFDTFLHATRGWKARRRWLLRSVVMLDVTGRFLRNRFRDAVELMAQDGIGKWSARRRLALYLLARPGILRRIFPAWLNWFKPGFHPWQEDDRHLVARHDSAFAAARMEAAPA